MVLASGEIVQARADNEHSELFWALRAGGPNFGIVTHFKVRTFPCSRLWAGMRAWGGPEGYPQAIAALKHWFAEGSNDPLASVTFAVTGKDSAMAVLCYNDGGKMENTPPSVFKKLLDVPARAGALTRTTLSDVTRGSFGIGEDGLRCVLLRFEAGEIDGGVDVMVLCTGDTSTLSPSRTTATCLSS